MVRSPTKNKGKRIHDGSDAAIPQRNKSNIQSDLSSGDEAMSESSNQEATTSSHANKKVPILPSIQDKFQFLRKGKSKSNKETHIYKCLVSNCGKVI